MPLSLVRHMLIRVSSISDDRIARIVELLNSTRHIDKYSGNDAIDDLIEQFEGKCSADISRDPFFKSEFHTYLDEFFEKYRFKPRDEDVKMYQKYGYKPPEDIEMNGLLDATASAET